MNKKFYKYIASALSLSLILGLAIAVPAMAISSTTVNVSPLTQVAATSQTFTVSINVNPQTAIAGVQFKLSFDTTRMTLNDDPEEGNLLNQNGAGTFFSMMNTLTNANSSGIIDVAGVITSPGQTVSTAGTFATVSFTAKTTEGLTALTLSDVKVGDASGDGVAIQITSGAVYIGTPPSGDVNGDYMVDAADITAVERMIAGLDTPTSGADANQDGQINALDITKVERIFAKLD